MGDCPRSTRLRHAPSAKSAGEADVRFERRVTVTKPGPILHDARQVVPAPHREQSVEHEGPAVCGMLWFFEVGGMGRSIMARPGVLGLESVRRPLMRHALAITVATAVLGTALLATAATEAEGQEAKRLFCRPRDVTDVRCNGGRLWIYVYRIRITCSRVYVSRQPTNRPCR